MKPDGYDPMARTLAIILSWIVDRVAGHLLGEPMSIDDLSTALIAAGFERFSHWSWWRGHQHAVSGFDNHVAVWGVERGPLYFTREEAARWAEESRLVAQSMGVAAHASIAVACK